MRNRTTLFAFIALVAVSCAPDSMNYYMKRSTLDFEGAYWDSLVDNPQYGGGLLYSATPYSWYDERTNLASDSTSSEYFGQYYWEKGFALSNYYTTSYDLTMTEPYEEQLTVFAEGAYSGKNCAVCTVYYDGVEDPRPSIYFKNKRGFIESMMIANTKYSRYSAKNGYRMAVALAEDESIWIEAEGFIIENGEEKSVAKAEFYLYKSGKPAFEGWKKWYMTSMCEVDKVKFDVKWDGVGENNHPKYFAIDDIVVVHKELKESVK